MVGAAMSADLQTEQNNAELADRTEGVALNTALGVDMQELRDAFTMVAERARTQPRAMWQATQYLLRQLFAITIGRSDIEPGQEDARFNTDEFKQSPYFRRVGQSFFAWSKALDMWLDQSGIAGRDRDRADFVLRTMREVLVPVNWLFGNPAAMSKLVASRGASLLSGLRNWVDDVQHNHGYPAVADRHAFRVGVDVAATQGKVVYRNDMFELMQYQPKTEQVSAMALLYVFSQVNRFYLGDLTPDRSLFQELLDAGIRCSPSAGTIRHRRKAVGDWVRTRTA